MTWNPKDDIYKAFGMTPDDELLLWENWIKIREKEVLKLGFRLDETPADLTMNLLEEVRRNKEEKKVLEECQIPKKAKLRGALWDQGDRLKQCCPDDNVYLVQRTAAEKGEPRIIVHIQCPEYIQKHEKGLLGEKERNPCSKLDLEYMQYKNKREIELDSQIKKIDPYRPLPEDIKELIVIGKRPTAPPKRTYSLPLVTVSPPLEPEEEPLSGVYAIRINNTIFVKQIPGQNVPHLENMKKEPWNEIKCNNWRYYFNVPEKRIGRGKIYLQNLGTVSLKYCWRLLKRPIPFIPEKAYEQKFFFNKNEDVISPGQNKTIYVTFFSEVAGKYQELWELNMMNVSLFDTIIGDKLVFNLIGDSVENVKKMNKKIEKFEYRIESKAMQMYIFNLLQEIIDEATGKRHELYPYKKWFLEEELFVARNMQHFYHQTEVNTLKELYKHMTGKDWDLKLLSWRDAILDKELEERLKMYEQLKKSHRILLTPWYEGDELITEKYRSVKMYLGQLADKFLTEFVRVCEWNGITEKQDSDDTTTLMSPIRMGPFALDIVHHIFYIRMYDHVANTIEQISGILSSLDLNRCLDFDFCRF